MPSRLPTTPYIAAELHARARPRAWASLTISAAPARASDRTLSASRRVPGPHPELRGRTLAAKDDRVRASIAAVAGVFDADVLTRVWERALAAPVWAGEPVWCHGDFHVGNLLMKGGRVTAVLDFGGLGYGDPACDFDMPSRC